MQRIIKIILSWFLIIAVPLVAVGFSSNVILRMPDVYQYEMNADKMLGSFNATGQEEDVALAISHYMQYRQDEFQYQYDEEDEMSLLFTKDEQQVMEHMRSMADIAAVMLAITLVICLISYIVLMKGEHFEAIRSRLKISLIIWLLISIAQMIIAFIPSIWGQVWNVWFATLTEEMLMYQILFSGFFQKFCLLNVLGSGILLGIIMYITWKYTKPKKIFW